MTEERYSLVWVAPRPIFLGMEGAQAEQFENWTEQEHHSACSADSIG